MHKLQYISQGVTAQEQLDNIQLTLQAGCKWIQLRWKQAEKEALLGLASTVSQICKQHCATFIINDHADIVTEARADGVHLGLTDMSLTEARALLGNSKIIGGTANTLDDVLQRVKEGADYIGLGPFRFTASKEKLSPILGIAGYKDIMHQLAALGINTPVYAIGGINTEDINSLLDTGVHGIAVSGLITNSPTKYALIKEIERILYRKEEV
jgi:thiamine-phosphate pyrophosphorylase